MSEHDIICYCEQSLPRLADELSIAFGLSSVHSEVAARASFEARLGKGFTQLTQQGNYLYLIMDEDQSIGALWFSTNLPSYPDHAYVLDVFVEPPHRNKGYGTAIISALVEEARSLGLTHVSLSVFEHNRAARELYEALGFKAASSILTRGL